MGGDTILWLHPQTASEKDSGVTLANRAADVSCLSTTLTWSADYIAGGDF